MASHDLPAFSLNGLRETPVGTARWLQQQRLEIVVALVDASCDQCRAFLEALARKVRADDLNASVVTIAMGDEARSEEDLPFANAADDGRAAAAVSRAMEAQPGKPLLVVADRYGSAHFVREIHEADPGALVLEAQEWVDFIQRQCPECGVPTW